MTDPLIAFVAVVLGLIAIVSVVLVGRNRLSFRIATRNIRRARGRTVLVMLGLLVGTAIISGSLVMGDTIRTINLHYSYLGWGYTDEGIFGAAPDGGNIYFPASVGAQVVNASSSDPLIAGVTPEIVDVVQVFDHTSGIPQTNLHLIGADGPTTTALGAFTSVTGEKSYAPAPGAVFLDQLAARDLNAAAGDRITLYGAVALNSTVEAVVLDDVRGGVLTAGLVGGAVFTDLATAQTVMQRPGQINVIAVTNIGSQSEGVGYSSTVSAHLNATLAAIPGVTFLSSHTLLQDSVKAAEAASSGTETIFLVFGLFSIVAGAMLIVGIFSMLAEERKGETGMLRAIGLTRQDVVLSYYFEGLLYAVGSALLGTFVGVGAGLILLDLYTYFVPSSVVGTDAILASFTVSQSSLLTSYLVGFLLTLGTVLVASVRVSRLTIVRAVRDTPEPPPPLRTYTYLAYLGIAGLALGLLLFAATFRGTSDLSWPVLGMGVAILGAGLIGSRFVKNRTVFSAVGLALLFWCGYAPLRDNLLGREHSGGIFILFVQGIMMIGGALMVVAFNGPDLARALERLASGRTGASPVTRIGFSYPSRRAARTSITLAIFALVLFTVVFLATYSATLTGNLNASVTAQSGGYTFFAASAQPIPDLPGSVASNGSLAPLFSALVPLVTGTVSLSAAGFTGGPFLDRVLAAPANESASASFYRTSQFPFLSTYHGLTASEVLAELEGNTSVAVVDGNYGSGGGFTAVALHPIVAVGDTVRVSNPATGASRNVTILGILQEQTLPGIWIAPAAAASLGYTTVLGYLGTVSPSTSVTHALQVLKGAFYRYGLAVVVFAEVLATTTSLISGEIGLLEVFIGLGLAVGIAALGILALRAVTERRREIGMLRAVGLTRGMVLRAFLLEYTYVTVLGSLIGGLLGLLIMYNLVHDPGAAAQGITALYVPWANLGLVILTTGVLATLAVIGPSLRGARLPPAEAIRSQG